jgi:hypothetical protein
MLSKISHLKNVFTIFRKNAFESEISSLKSPLLQLIEIFQLRVGPGKLDAGDYYLYQLYDDSRYIKAEKLKFMSMGGMPHRITSSPWNILAVDKHLFYTLMEGFGANIPNNIALYHASQRGDTNMRVLKNTSDLKLFLSNDATYPMVVKPVDGIFSKDVRIIMEHRSDDEIIVLGDGSEIKIDEFVKDVAEFSRRGALFQELLIPHPEIIKVCGHRICTVRIITSVSDSGVELLYGIWKITVGSHMADNYWRGNMMAGVDLKTGQVGRPVTGMGKNMSYPDTHPDTGKILEGFMLPDWDKAREQCLKLSSCLYGLPIQAWDVALTDKGPVFLEVNIVGSLFLPQIAFQEGFLNDKVKGLINEYL